MPKFFNQKKRHASFIAPGSYDEKDKVTPDLFAKHARFLKKYDVNMDITGSVFFYEFNHADKSFLPKFVVSIQSLSKAKMICTMDSRSHYRKLFDYLKETALMTDLIFTVKEIEWARSVEYEYIGNIESVKALFRFINSQIYADAYLLIEEKEYTSLEVFENLWEKAYENYKKSDNMTRVESISNVCSFVKPINDEVDSGSFSFIFLGTKLPWLDFQMLSEKECLLTITINRDSSFCYSEAISKIAVLSKQLEKQETDDSCMHKFTFIFSELKENVVTILNQEIFSGYFSRTSENSKPRSLGKIFEEKLEEAKESFQKRGLQISASN